jgi:tRNA dimethylallyltransferase
VYRGLGILSGAAGAGEQALLEHRMVGFVDIRDTYSVGEYATRAHAEIDALLSDGRDVIVVGGTGLYLRAAVAELDLAPPAPAPVRERWLAALADQGAAQLHRELMLRAPLNAQTIAESDGRRIVRALELHEIGALAPPLAQSQLWTEHTRHPTRMIGLVREREELYARIDARVEEMIRLGAVEEVRAAQRVGASHTARVALGFQELLEGDVEAMKRRTRNYAKRQLTWMRKLAGVELIDITGRSPDDVAAALQ